jgi:hypothetical protein
MRAFEIVGGFDGPLEETQHLSKCRRDYRFKNRVLVESVARETVSIFGRKPKAATSKLQCKILKRIRLFTINRESLGIERPAVRGALGIGYGVEEGFSLRTR